MGHQWQVPIWWGDYFICLHFDSKWLDFRTTRIFTIDFKPVTWNLSDCTIRQVIIQVTAMLNLHWRDYFQMTYGMVCCTISQFLNDYWSLPNQTSTITWKLWCCFLYILYNLPPWGGFKNWCLKSKVTTSKNYCALDVHGHY